MSAAIDAVSQRLRERAYGPWSRYFCRASLLEGEPAHGGDVFRCLLVGDTPFTAYVRERLFTRTPRVVSSRRVFLPRVPAVARAWPLAQMCVADVPLRHARRVASAADWTAGPMVCQAIELGSEWAAARSHPRKARRAAAKQGYTLTRSRDRADCRWFYERIYRPHVLNQFGALAAVKPYAEVEKRLSDGELLFVESAGRRIAGCLEYRSGDTLTGYVIGVLDGDRQLVTQGALAALYSFAIDDATAHGYRLFDLQSSRPFLNDGPFAFKRHWGASVARDPSPESAASFFVLDRTPGFTEAFLRRHPLVVDGPDGLEALVACPTGESGDDAGLRSRFFSPGLVRLRIVEGGGEERVVVL